MTDAPIKFNLELEGADKMKAELEQIKKLLEEVNALWAKFEEYKKANPPAVHPIYIPYNPCPCPTPMPIWWNGTTCSGNLHFTVNDSAGANPLV